MSSTAFDDQFETMIGSGGGLSNNSYGAVPPLGMNTVGATGSFTLPSGTISIATGGGGGGGTGQIYTSTGWQNSSNVTMSTTILSIKADDGGDAYIKTNKHKINLDDLADSVEVLKQRLLVLTPNFELHEKYPALKDLYEQYKVMEAMLQEEPNK